jgi:hypothetical protein
MISVLFRLMDVEGEPSGVFGLASAPNKERLFWVIDEFCDPNMVELKTVTRSGVCVHVKEEDGAEVCTNWQTTESFPFHYEGKWRKPKWKISFA